MNTTVPTTGVAFIKAANRATMRRELAEGQTKLQAMPRVLFVELTRFCNLACIMCREPGTVGREQRMSQNMFEHVAEELFPTAEIVDLRGWGESLILPEWPERLATTRSYGCSVRIVTNLSFRRPKVLEGLAEASAWVGVSLDGASQEVLAATRRGASFSLIYENLLRLGAAYGEAGITDRLRIYTTCQRPNLATLENLVDIAARTGVPVISISPATVPAGNLVSIDGMQEQIKDAMARMKERAQALGVDLVQSANLWEGQFVKDVEGPCGHPWTHAYVTYNLGVGFCDHLIGPHGDSFLMGNLQETPFSSIWNGTPWQALRAEHLGARRAAASNFEECAWCYRNRYTDFEDLLEPNLEAGRRYVHRAAVGIRSEAKAHS